MGGVQSKQQKIERYNKINPNKWQKTGQDGITQFAVDQNGREGQINVIKLDPTRKVDDELEVYYYRRTFQGPLVKCYGAQALKGKAPGVCGVDNSMKVITERIIKRWRQLPQLTFPQALNSLDQALEGYKVLFGQVGPFQVNHSMLGINNQGDLRVWLNQNFADNNPSLERGVLYTTNNSEQLFGVNSETDMVDNIYRVISQKCEQGKFPEDFNHQFSSNKTSFNTALQAIDNFTASKNIVLPSKIHPDSSLMYVSKTKGLPLTSNIKSTTSNYTYQQQSSPLKSINISPYKDSQNKVFSLSQDQRQKQQVDIKKQKQFSIGDQAVYNSTYVKQGDHKLRQASQRTVSFGGNQGSINAGIGYQTGGYQTGGFYSNSGKKLEQNKYEWERKNYDLRQNPNINAAESIYEPKQRTPPPSWIKSESGNASPLKQTQSKAGLIGTNNMPVNLSTSNSNARNITFTSGSPTTVTYAQNAPVTISTFGAYGNQINTNPTNTANIGGFSPDSYKVGKWDLPPTRTTHVESTSPFKKDQYSNGAGTNLPTGTYSYKETTTQVIGPSSVMYTNPALFQKPKFNYISPAVVSTAVNAISDQSKTGNITFSNPEIQFGINKPYPIPGNDVMSTTGNFILATGTPNVTFNKPNNNTNETIQTSQVTRQF